MKGFVKVLRWIVAACIAVWGIAMFGVGNPISGIFTILLAFAVSPLSTIIVSKLNIQLKKSVCVCTFCALFLVSCGTSLALTDTPADSAKVEAENEIQEVSRSIEIDSDGISDIPVANIEEHTETEPEPNKLKVHFIDVGQGDSTLIEYQNEFMLIDAGPDSSGTRIQKYLYDNNVSGIKYLVLTHPDSDHIGGADVIVTKFDVEKILMSSYINDSDDYMHLLEAIGSKEYSWEIPSEGEEFALGDVKITILQSKDYVDANNSSICLRVDYDDTSFIFTGDSEETAENDMLASNADIEATVYQVGHHGSYTSSSQQFLDKMHPQYAVISCGVDNVYSHPHQETIDKLREMNVSMFRTDVQGTIIASTDGKVIEWSIDPSTKFEGGSSEYERSYRDSLNQSTSDETTRSIEGGAESVAIATGVDAITSDGNTDANDNTSTDSNISSPSNGSDSTEYAFIGNKNNMKLHKSSCTGKLPKESNREYFNSLEEAEAAGYKSGDQCQICMP